MEMKTRLSCQFLPAAGFLSQEVGHHHVRMTLCRAQRPATYGPDVLLEL
jgi:hypothetical protein